MSLSIQPLLKFHFRLHIHLPIDIFQELGILPLSIASTSTTCIPFLLIQQPLVPILINSHCILLHLEQPLPLLLVRQAFQVGRRLLRLAELT